MALDGEKKIGKAAAPLWNQIFEEIRLQIESGVYPPDSPLPPELELAARWQVSRLTAHRALYELQRAGLVTRKRKVGTVVVGPRPPQTVRIAALFFHAGDYFQGNLLASVRGGLSDDVQLAYVDTNRDPEAEAAALMRMSEEAEAIILFPTCDSQNNAILRKLSARGFPLVCVDRHPVSVDCDSVQTDNYAATFRALMKLFRDGHQRIAFFCDHEEPVSSTSDRLRAYHDLLEVVGGDPQKHFHAFPYRAPNSDAEYREMIEMVTETLTTEWARPDRPTAIFCSREHYAAAVLEACAQIGICIPEQLQILAFVDRPSYLLNLPESVQRIHQDLDTIGKTAAKRVLLRLSGEKLPYERILVPPLPMNYESGAQTQPRETTSPASKP